MDLELMINSLPKLINAAVITLKLLSVSLIIGLFIWALRAWKTEQVEEAEFSMKQNAPKEIKVEHA